MIELSTSPLYGVLLFAVGMMAGALNAVAGGGTFFAFPTLLLIGAPPVAANATCTIALWPASLASVYAFRKHMGEHLRRILWVIALGVLGGWAGARLLLLTPDATFSWMIPWLLLVATLLFTYGKRFAAWIAKRTRTLAWGQGMQRMVAVAMLCITALYGGFFGAGLGILTLATLYALGIEEDMHRLNAVKTVVAAAVNAAAFFTFLFSGTVLWHYAWVMMAGGVMGGFFGAKLSLRVSAQKIRRSVIVFATLATAYFFIKTYLWLH
jgi:uncharacterized protein